VKKQIPSISFIKTKHMKHITTSAKAFFAFALFGLTSVSLTGAETSVIVHLLDHTGKGDTANESVRPLSADTRPLFWIDWSKNWRPVTATKTVKGAEADALNAQIKLSLESSESDNQCGHDPIYGIEATTSDGKVLKTSVCFTCGTWVQPEKRLSISEPHGIENPLCVSLRKVIELPKEILDAEAAKKAEKVSK
jgi:hypothetical protein